MADGLHSGTVATEYNQVKTADFDQETIRLLYKAYLRKRLIIFALRSFISLRELIYNVRLITRYPKGAVYAIRNAILANG